MKNNNIQTVYTILNCIKWQLTNKWCLWLLGMLGVTQSQFKKHVSLYGLTLTLVYLSVCLKHSKCTALTDYTMQCVSTKTMAAALGDGSHACRWKTTGFNWQPEAANLCSFQNMQEEIMESNKPLSEWDYWGWGRGGQCPQRKHYQLWGEGAQPRSLNFKDVLCIAFFMEPQNPLLCIYGNSKPDSFPVMVCNTNMLIMPLHFHKMARGDWASSYFERVVSNPGNQYMYLVGHTQKV